MWKLKKEKLSKHLYSDYTVFRRPYETDKMLSLRIKITLDLDEILNGQMDELRFKDYCKIAILKSQEAANTIKDVVEKQYPQHIDLIEKYLILR
jgi:hypothetical protein